jgi:hypothetical protein
MTCLRKRYPITKFDRETTPIIRKTLAVMPARKKKKKEEEQV